MKLIFNILKRQYVDWRYWSYIYKNMKRNNNFNKKMGRKKDSANIPYLDKPGIAFSFDDSFRVQDWYSYGKDLFGFYDVKVTFNVNAHHHYEGRRKHTQSEIDMLLDLQSNGHEIAHHGYNHQNAVEYSEVEGIEKWIEEDITRLFNWLEKQSHSITGEKFKKPITFVFPYFRFNEQTLNAIVPKYFKIARGHLAGNNLTPHNHTGFAPSICIDSHYLSNPRNVKRVLKYVKKSGSNLILTCHSILSKDREWEKFGWHMESHEQRWRTCPKNLQYLINQAKKNDLEFYTTAELSGIATFIDRNFEKYIRELLVINPNQWIYISQLKNIKELNLCNQKITNLDGIQYFINLEELDISNNNINDLRLLEKLQNLKKVICENKATPKVI